MECVGHGTRRRADVAGTGGVLLAARRCLHFARLTRPDPKDAAFCTANGFEQNCYGITTGQKSLIVSILSAGTFVGALLAYPMGDILGALAPLADLVETAGRKYGLIASCMIVFNLGVALQTASTSIPLFVVGRVLAGLGVGLVSCLVPM